MGICGSGFKHTYPSGRIPTVEVHEEEGGGWRSRTGQNGSEEKTYNDGDEADVPSNLGSFTNKTMQRVFSVSLDGYPPPSFSSVEMIADRG